MTEVELKKLNRAELLAMLISMTRRCEELEAELQDAKKALEDRTIAIEESGSLAEAVLKINKVFEAADNASLQYLENVQSKNPDGSFDGGELLKATRAKCDAMERSTEERCIAAEEETARRCIELVETAKAESQAYWDEVHGRIQEYTKSMTSIKDYLVKMFEEKHRSNEDK